MIVAGGAIFDDHQIWCWSSMTRSLDPLNASLLKAKLGKLFLLLQLAHNQYLFFFTFERTRTVNWCDKILSYHNDFDLHVYLTEEVDSNGNLYDAISSFSSSGTHVVWTLEMGSEYEHRTSVNKAGDHVVFRGDGCCGKTRQIDNKSDFR